MSYVPGLRLSEIVGDETDVRVQCREILTPKTTVLPYEYSSVALTKLVASSIRRLYVNNQRIVRISGTVPNRSAQSPSDGDGPHPMGTVPKSARCRIRLVWLIKGLLVCQKVFASNAPKLLVFHYITLFFHEQNGFASTKYYFHRRRYVIRAHNKSFNIKCEIWQTYNIFKATLLPNSMITGHCRFCTF